MTNGGVSSSIENHFVISNGTVGIIREKLFDQGSTAEARCDAIMSMDAINGQQNTSVAVRCNQCMRIIAYKISAGTGRIQIKCPKCGKEMLIDLSLRRSKGKLFYRMAH